MVITHHGGNYLKLQAGELSVLIDPLDQRSFRGTTVVLNTTLPAHTEPSEEATGRPVWIDHAGEYEVKEIEIQGWSTGHDGNTEHTAYRFRMDEITVGVLGHLTQDLPEDVREALTGVDILFVPAGGKPWLSETAAAKLARELEPSVVIPTLFKDLKPFAKAFGQASFTAEEKIVLKKKGLVPGALTLRPIQS